MNNENDIPKFLKILIGIFLIVVPFSIATIIMSLLFKLVILK